MDNGNGRQRGAMLERMIGAARLDAHTYEEVEADETALRQALLVVVLVALATGIGSLGGGSIVGLVSGVFWSVIGWALWAFTTYIVGTTLFRGRETEATWGQLARTMGFAQSPGLLRLFGFIPVVGPLIFFVTGIWQLVAMTVAVRQALDYRSSLRALGVVVVGFIPYALILGLIQYLLVR